MASNHPCPNCGYVLPSELNGDMFHYCPQCGSLFGKTTHVQVAANRDIASNSDMKSRRNDLILFVLCIIIVLLVCTIIALLFQLVIFRAGSPSAPYTIETPVDPTSSAMPPKDSVPNETEFSLTPSPHPASGYIFEAPHSLDSVAPFCVETSGEGGYYFVLEPLQYGTGMTTKERDALKNYNFCFYVRAGVTTEVLVPLGIYRVYYAYGGTWYGIDHLFGPDTVYNKCDDTFTFSKDGQGYRGWTLTLDPVINGNLDTDIIPEADFPK